ncbi:MAG: hypothetical protein EOO05_00405 [Chitinophagaceae bacterium]|nr:MAG: hypothetical protein EOO05_00405 [Chitinophagaceae bacterium]
MTANFPKGFVYIEIRKYFYRMGNRLLFTGFGLFIHMLIFGQDISPAASVVHKDTRLFKGMYLQWGYNADAYSHSNIHFRMSNGDNFKLHRARAHDSGDFDAIVNKPVEISIPQYNYRIGFYLNKERTRAIEINFDHTKYILSDFQKVHITGTIDGVPVDGDSILNPQTFLHFEHSDGANWLHINYVRLGTLLKTHSGTRPLIKYVYKAGAGINIPRSDIRYKGERLNNDFHVAGYNMSLEAGLRFYALRHFFIETTGKSGYVRYINALANTEAMKGNRVTHGFAFIECIATIGFDFSL